MKMSSAPSEYSPADMNEQVCERLTDSDTFDYCPHNQTQRSHDGDSRCPPSRECGRQQEHAKQPKYDEEQSDDALEGIGDCPVFPGQSAPIDGNAPRDFWCHVFTALRARGVGHATSRLGGSG